MVANVVQPGLRSKNLAQCLLKSLRPVTNAGIVSDQVLANLDKRMRESARCPVPVHAVVPERPVVGLVVADGQGSVPRQCLDERHRKPRVRSQRMPTCQGRGTPRHTSVKLWIDTIAGGWPAAIALSICAAIARW